MNARGWSFASLLLLAGPALADEPAYRVEAIGPKEQQTPPHNMDHPDIQGVDLTAKWQTEVRGHRLFVMLTLVNAGVVPVDVIANRDEGAGPDFWATVGGKTLSMKRSKEGERWERDSRIGPSPRFTPLAVGGEVTLERYILEIPADRASDVVDITVFAEMIAEGGQYFQDKLTYQVNLQP